MVEANKLESGGILMTYEKGLNYALYLLSGQMRTRKEIADKLVLKGYEAPVIESVLQILDENKYLDDVNYAQIYIRSKRSKYGDYRLDLALIKKGVSQHDLHLARQLLEEDASDDYISAEEIAEKVLEKKIAVTEIDWDRVGSDYAYKGKLYQKFASFLAGRGFSGGIIKKVVGKRLSQEFFDE